MTPDNPVPPGDSRNAGEDQSPDQAAQHQIDISGQWAAVAQVADACDLSRDTLFDAAAKGAVWVQRNKSQRLQKPVRIRNFDQVSTGDRVLVNYAPRVLAQQPSLPTLVADEKNYSVWDKPVGLLSQGSKWSDHCTVTSTVQQIHERQALLVHRLDRAARGLIVVAHTKNAVKALTGLFAARNVEKTYRAVVHGTFPAELPQVIDFPIDNKAAHTEIVAATAIPQMQRTELTIKIQTGRKHQIRSHLMQSGYPVVGDRLFDPQREHRDDLQLLAAELRFDCPFTRKPCHYVTNLTIND